jgi:hypothetical protein
MMSAKILRYACRMGGRMSEPIPAEVVLWRQLGKYLKTETEVSEPETISYPRRNDRPTEVIHLKVRFSNTAVDEADGPRTVFTGVGLGIVKLDSMAPYPPKWTIQDVKIEKPNQRGQSHIVVGARPDGWSYQRQWADLTQDESEHGIALFPGESATLELTIPVRDIPKYELHIQGSVSRRHFFHYDRALRIMQA